MSNEHQSVFTVHRSLLIDHTFTMEQSQKPKSWKKKIGIGAGIYIAVIVILIVAAVLLSTEVPLADSQDGITGDFTLLSSIDRTDLLSSGILIPSTAPTLGKPEAKITIVEFSDFQCPFCKASFSVIRRIVENYPDDVLLVYRHFPLESIHPLSKDLAHASMCAQDQGKFWQFHDRIFQQQDSITKNNIIEQAKAVGLDINLFVQCQSSGKWNEAIEQDFADIVSLGGKGTPTWIVNGELIQGHFSYKLWARIIESLL